MGLTPLVIKAAQGRDKQHKLADSGGLYFIAFPSGQRYWHIEGRSDARDYSGHSEKYERIAA